MFIMPNNIILADDERIDAIVTASEGQPNLKYMYGVRKYITDDYADFRAYDDEGNRVAGIIPRLTVDEAWEWVGANGALINAINGMQADRNYWREEYNRLSASTSTLYSEVENLRFATHSFVKYAAEKGREYAIDNSLCENYERYLMLVINREATRIGNEHLLDGYGESVHNEDSEVGRTYRDLAKLFLRHATRTRGMTVTVGRKYNAYGINSSNISVGEQVTDYYGYDEEVRTINTESVLSYEECVKANEYGVRNGWQYGHQALASE